MHGIAHMGWTSAEEMDYALSLPDYRSVLRTDEDSLITKNRVVRVLARPDPGAEASSHRRPDAKERNVTRPA